jgi:hypothetical protein
MSDDPHRHDDPEPGKYWAHMSIPLHGLDADYVHELATDALTAIAHHLVLDKEVEIAIERMT